MPASRKTQQPDRAAIDALRTKLASFMDARGMRSTSQRRAIIETFFSGPEHLTIEALLTQVRRRDKGIGYATVYRTLKLLTESGVAREHQFGDGLSRYELADEATRHHDHLICKKCGSITEFEEPRIEVLQEGIAKRFGFRVESHNHEIYGTCRECQR